MNEIIMDGIRIINVGHEVGKSNPLYVILGVLLGMFAAITIYYIICTVLEDIFDIDTSDSDENIKSAIYNYVIIGDNVSFNEFTEQYEIISQNGSIYTVKEKIK